RDNSEVSTRLMTPDEAIEAGATALFGEKYGDEVRVVAMGSTDGNEAFSTELCGGTHARRTGDIGLFRIVSESAVAAGVRRIEAVTGAAAQSYIADEAKALSDAAAVLKVSPADLPGRIESLLDERRKMEKEITELRRQMATGGGGGSASDIKEISGIKFAGKTLDGVPAKDLKSLADDLKGQVGSGVVALISVNDGKASLVVGVTDDLAEKISAVDLVRAGSEAVGGKGGGGRPDMAQAGGPDGGNADAAINAIEEAISASA
ncbi:MAG TPA: DHHA1 domain-containing protein, partial [Rhodospirillales bacterium]|nr:DHHA1 domain-containing protein [Rhodospirillales bacterium]